MSGIIPQPKNGLGYKIAWSQIEDGKKIVKFLEEYEKLKGRIEYLIETGFNDKMENFQKQLDELKNLTAEFTESSFEIIKNYYATDLSKLQQDLKEFIIYAEDTYMKKKDKIYLYNLDEDLIDLIIGGPSSPNLQIDKDKNLRRVAWRCYFATSNAWLSYNDIPNSDNNPITMEDWYGPNFEKGDFSNAKVDLFYYGDIYKFVSEDIRKNDSEWFANAISNIETNRVNSIYVPKAGIDDLTKYSKIPYFGTVSFDTETKLIQFEAGRTVDYMFCFVKYAD